MYPCKCEHRHGSGDGEYSGTGWWVIEMREEKLVMHDVMRAAVESGSRYGSVT